MTEEASQFRKQSTVLRGAAGMREVAGAADEQRVRFGQCVVDGELSGWGDDGVEQGGRDVHGPADTAGSNS